MSGKGSLRTPKDQRICGVIDVGDDDLFCLDVTQYCIMTGLSVYVVVRY